MNNSVINQQLIKQFNTNKVLKLIHGTKTISRAELAKQSGLNKATVSKLTDELLNDNLILDLGFGHSSGGRKPKLLKFNPDAKFIVGINIGVSDLYYTIMNMDLEEVFTKRIDVEDNTLEYTAEVLKALFESSLEETAIKEDDIIEIAIAVPATVEVSGTIIHAPNLGWRNVDPNAAFEHVFNGIPLNIFNEANAGALGAFHHVENAEEQNLVYVSAGIGIGTGIIISGHLYRGKLGTAGEFGHNVIVENGRKCHCGRQGCWEMYASEQALYKHLEDKGLLIQHNIKQILTELENKNPIVVEAIEELSSYINIGLTNVARALNPDYLIIGNKLRKLKGYLNIEEDIDGSKVLFFPSENHATIEGMGSVITRKYLYEKRYLV